MVYTELMARQLEPALFDLLELCRLRERGRFDNSPLFEATVSVGGDSETLFARVSLWRPRAGDAVRIYTWGWVLNCDLARYFGDNPPPRTSDELLRLRGPVDTHDSEGSGFSMRIARRLCERVGGTDIGAKAGLPFFSLSLASTHEEQVVDPRRPEPE